ncbi:Sec1-like protein [Exidia glandulosa HHB12029]|uniref:Sec1-like protein n=1 Tax=Exidia glandulosa HHB12029 TaxID=1314781 RepID=A0A165CJP2_EXIGL|nr:Sec1-like protein [Exidia glandulosa HHB12029]
MPSTAPSIDSSKPEIDPSQVVDVGVLKELAKRYLVDALNSVNGPKTLVLDPSLAGPLGLVTEVALLKQHGVDKMFWLEPGPLQATTTNIIYLCRPQVQWAKLIAEHVKQHTKESQNHVYTLLVVPRESSVVKRILEDEGVLGDIHISEYNLQFIPLEDDLISLEYDHAFKEIWLDGDETAVYNSAQALLTLQKIYGLFPRIIGKGDHAAKLKNLLKRLQSQSPRQAPGSHTLSEKIDSLFIIDRRVDMVTPLLTQLTYQGLVDELMGMTSGHVELPASLLAAPTAQQTPSASAAASTSAAGRTALTKEKKKKHHLTAANDTLFRDLRDLNFSVVGANLSRHAHRLDSEYQSRHQAKTVPQLKEFVGKLGGLQTETQSLKLHTGLCEIVDPQTKTEVFNKSLEIQQNLLALYDVNAQISAIEDLVAQGVDVAVVLRLLCLASIVAPGIKPKVFENLSREILQTYGYHYLPLLLNLSTLHLLTTQPLSPAAQSLKLPLSALKKSLRLLTEENETDNDISYVYSGYAPLSVRLVQCVAQKGALLAAPAPVGEEAGAVPKAKAPKTRSHPIVGWKGFEDVVASFPGEVFDVVQAPDGGATDSSANAVSVLLPREDTTTTVVFFLGGCTYTEVAALRWMASQMRGRRFLIATTGIIKGSSLIEDLATSL